MTSLLSTLQSAAAPPPQQPARDTSAAQAANAVGARADDAMAGLVDDGNVFDDGSADD